MAVTSTARAMAKIGDATTVVIVEGISDQIAVETAATGRGRDLAAERTVVVPIGGAHAIGRFLATLGPPTDRIRLAGLCDSGEAELFRRALTTSGVGTVRTLADLPAVGFHICVDDLEDELIRSVGPAGVEELFETNGDLGPFRSMRNQPAWRGREPPAQMRRFLGSGARRKLRYARLLVEAAIARDALPPPLDGLLEFVDRG